MPAVCFHDDFKAMEREIPRACTEATVARGIQSYIYTRTPDTAILSSYTHYFTLFLQMPASKIFFLAAGTLLPGLQAIAAHAPGNSGNQWWMPLVLMIGTGLALVLWDEFIKSLRALRN